MGKKLTHDDYIKKAKEVHGDKYDYSKTIYVNSRGKVIIMLDGVEYEQVARSHTDGFCPEVNTTGLKYFISKSIQLYGDKYDLGKVEYVNNNTKVIIGCKTHGDFEVVPRNFTSGFGCSKCSRGTLSMELFLEKAKEIHGDKYDYSKSKFVYNYDKIIIECNTGHGEFTVSVDGHLNSGTGCSKCSGNRKLTTSEFISKSREIYEEYNYSYDKTEYSGYGNPVTITCPEHGDFVIIPSLHLNSNSKCVKCRSTNKWTYEYFIEKSKEIHGDRYSYPCDKYVNSNTKTTIICPLHGEFTQLPEAHIRNTAGCPTCKISKGEKCIKDILDNYGILYLQQHKFSDCKNIFPLPFDFYLPFENLCIEFDGRQHYEPVYAFGGEEEFALVKMRDNIKNKYCEENTIDLIRISYQDFDKIAKILDFLNPKNKIKND